MPHTTIPKLTGFFRAENRNTAVFARHLAVPLARRLGTDILRIADIGTSSGKATLTTAGGLAMHKAIDFRIDGFDVDEDMLAAAHGPYLGSLRNLRELFNSELIDPAYSPGLLKHFKSAPGGVQASQYVRDRVTFHLRDVLTEPLPHGAYHVGIATNVLYHYRPAERDKFLRHILGGIAEGGIFMPEMPAAPSERPEYDSWYEDLTKNYPLESIVAENPQAFPGTYQKTAE